MTEEKTVTVRVYEADRQQLNEIQAGCMIRGRRIKHSDIIRFLLKASDKANVIKGLQEEESR